tara:strand:- start:468 stop:599 length:132 start_codon:yes stop_codon:yes gene_type:complete
LVIVIVIVIEKLTCKFQAWLEMKASLLHTENDHFDVAKREAKK